MDQRDKVSTTGRLSYFCELIACIAVGFWSFKTSFAVSGGTWAFKWNQAMRPGAQSDWIISCLGDLGKSFGAGFTTACGVGLSIETFRHRRGPMIWGMGRLSIAIVATTIVLMAAINIAIDLRLWIQFGTVPFFVNEPTYIFQLGSAVRYFGDWLPISLATALVVFRFSGRLSPSRPDAREWVGRSIMATMLSVSAFWNVFLNR